MDFSIIETVSKYLLVPDYYTEKEKRLAVAVTLLVLVGFAIMTFVVSAAKLKAARIIALIALIGAAVAYWLLFDVGNAFGWQLLSRSVFFLAFGALFGKLAGGEENAGSGGG